MQACVSEAPRGVGTGSGGTEGTFFETAFGDSTTIASAPSGTHLATPDASPQTIVEGFALEVSKTVGGDLRIEWQDQGVEDYEVWTSSDPYFVPDGPGAVMVQADDALFFETALGSEAYYRVRAIGAAQEFSTAVGQVEYPLGEGYSKLGVCLVSEIETFYDLCLDLDTWPNQGYLWDPDEQEWLTNSTLTSATFSVGDVIIARYEDEPSPATYSWVGYVPTEADVSTSLQPGTNYVTTLPLHFGPIWASELLAMVEHGERVGSPDPFTQAERWYPDDPDWLMPTCSPVIVEVTAASPWPPGGSGAQSSGDADDGDADGGEAGAADGEANGDGAGVDADADGGEDEVGDEVGEAGGGEGGDGDEGGGEVGGDDGGDDGTPDPELVAPPLDPTVTTSFFDAVSFLFEGDPPVQTGVTPGTIEPLRIAVLRGEVRERDGDPLGGVVVSAVGHPEFGSTQTRADGRYDFAVNGGARILLSFVAQDMLPAQRVATPRWQTDVEVDPVALVGLDPEVSIVDFEDPIEIHVASSVTDADGTRTNVLLFREGTVATMVMPNGSESVLPSISVRATEYTVGEEGPDAMPGELPTATAYTYAVEYTIDEAESAGAVRVELDPPAISYLENFVGFPVGGIVPLGAYDPRIGGWSAEANGRVIEVLGESGGLATIDITGDGVADDSTALAAVGIDADEREALASEYGPGTELWRMPVAHMSPWDANWGFGPPDGAGPPPSDPPPDDRPPPQSCEAAGSIIECEGQVLGEEIPISGTGYSLAYRSDRVPGRAASFQFRVPLRPVVIIGPWNPPGSAEVIVRVAGREFSTVYDPYFSATSDLHTFAWDGLDAYGRRVQGPVPIDACVNYTYPVYFYTPEDIATGAFGYNGTGTILPGSRSSSTLTFQQCHSGQPIPGGIPVGSTTVTNGGKSWGGRFTVGTIDARRSAAGLGGWTLSAHHQLAPEAEMLYLGNGERVANAFATDPFIVQRFAGTSGQPPNDGMGGPALEARIQGPGNGVMGPDGSIYVTTGNRIRRIDPDGIIHAFAGTGTAGATGDGGSATAARLNNPRGLAVGPDGSVYVADWLSHRVRRIDPDGIITTIAGTGAAGSLGDGGSATSATVVGPMDVELAPDGTIYVLQGDRIRRIQPDGIITRFAGGSPCGGGLDGVSARSTCLWGSRQIALGPDGAMYVSYSQNSSQVDQIYRIGADGIMRRIAGSTTNNETTNGEGIPATDAWIDNLQGLAVSETGLVFFSDAARHRVRYIDAQGDVHTLLGTGDFGGTGDGGPARQARVAAPWGVFFGQDDALYVVESQGHRIRRMSTSRAGIAEDERFIPSADHRELWVFDARGRHLRTLDATTAVVRRTFGYDDVGLLVTVTDAYAAVTEIVRDSAGVATAIIGPDGHETALGMNPDGYLESVTNPAGETHEFGYGNGGLLTELISPNEGLHTFDYDALGRLELDTGPEGGSTLLTRTESGGYLANYEVELESTLGRTKSVAIGINGDGRVRTVTHPDGTETVQQWFYDGTEEIVRPDGTTIRRGYFGDPRFGMFSPTLRREVETPEGVLQQQMSTRSVTLDDPYNLLSVETVTETSTVNGRTYQRVRDVGAGTAVMSSPEGREYSAAFDTYGRVSLLEAPGVEPVAFGYDDRGRVEEAVVGVGLGARTWTFVYDLDGNLMSTMDPLGRVNEMTHDPIGRVLDSIAPDEATTEFDYDDNGNLTGVTPPGRPVHAFAYDADDRNTAYVPPDLGAGTETTQYVYDDDDALVEVLRPNSQVIDFVYDAAGRVETIEAPEGNTEVSYNPVTGQVSEVEGPGGGRILYSYDGSLVTAIETTGVNAAVLSWTHDDDMRRETATVEGVTYALAYDDDGLLLSVGDVDIDRVPATGFPSAVTVDAIETAIDFDATGALEGLSSEYDSTELLSFAYQRDALGRIVSVTETPIAGGPPSARVTEYEYDLGGRLETVTVDSVVTHEYAYDDNGNRQSVTTPGGTVMAFFDAHDRMVEQGDVELEYDVTGELVMRVDGVAVTQYEHDAFGRLVAVELPDATLIEYDLDARGRRVGRRVDSVLEQAWVYDGQLDPVAELDGDGDVVMRFVYGSMPHVPDLIERGADTYRVVTDHLGSVRLVVNADTGVVAQRLEYGPWGEVLEDTNPGFQPFGFAGGIYDTDTGLVQFGAREYDAGLGRWVSRDPVLFDGGMNLFAYAANDPVNLADPNGENPAAAAAVWCAAVPACAAVAANAAAHAAGLAALALTAACIQSGLCLPEPDDEWRDDASDPAESPANEPAEPVCGPPPMPIPPPYRTPAPKPGPAPSTSGSPPSPPPRDGSGCRCTIRYAPPEIFARCPHRVYGVGKTMHECQNSAKFSAPQECRQYYGHCGRLK